ncbi:PAS domain S-box protein [Chryseolinea lacunae]|uniref:histidine kinase n=1 Tax=Chryseolinea lacunae TaxID=2801331 RepID=A0ABS1L2A2_9BACT|nr:PAS domain S-box protein [Chryseolinea lacunae]MBL0745829.1 PAS domain S-box protein [Chryseolinea lacunae]
MTTLRYTILSRAMSMLVGVVACAVLAGWLLDVDVLKRPVKNLMAMNPMTASGLLLASIAIYLQFSKTPWQRRLRNLSSLAVIALGTMKLASFANHSLLVDTLLFKGHVATDALQHGPNAMAPSAGLNFVLIGTAMLLRKRSYWFQSLAVLVFLLTWFPMLGYLYHVPEFDGTWPFFPMAVHTAACFMLLSVALLFAQPRRGWMNEFTSEYEGGFLTRFMLPFAIVLPVALGYLRLWTHRVRLFSTEFGVTALVTSIMTVFILAIAYAVRLLNRRDMQRRKILDELARVSHQWKENNNEVASLNEELRSSNEEYQAINEQLVELNLQLEQANKTIALQKDEQLNRILELTGNLAWSVDLTGQGEHYVSRSIEKLIGQSAKTFLDDPQIWQASIHPADRWRHAGALEQVGIDDFAEAEYRIVVPGHDVKWMHAQYYQMRDGEGVRLRREIFISDITARKQVELEMRQKQNLLERSYAVANIGHWIRNPQTEDTYYSKEMLAIYGLHEKTGRYAKNILAPLVHPDDAAAVLELFDHSLREKKPFETEHRIVRPDGAVRWVHHKADLSPGNDEDVLVGITQDITERKIIEDALREFNERYDILSKATNDAIWDWDLLRDRVIWNHGLETIFGYKHKRVDGTATWRKEKIHADDYNRVSEGIETAFAEGQTHWIAQYRHRCADGTYKHVLDRAYVIYQREKPVRMIGALQDVTDQKEFERSITAIARELSDLITHANTPIFGTDRNGYVNEWNNVTAQLTGFSKNEVFGKKLIQFVAGQQRDTFEGLIGNVVENHPVSNIEMHMVTKGHRTLIILLNATPRRNSLQETVGTLMVGQNITELIEYRQNLESKVRERTQELNEALLKEKELVDLKSKFVSTASHEFRTPLSSIALVSGFLRKHAQKLTPEAFAGKLDAIEKQVTQMTFLLDDLLVIGKADAGKIEAHLATVVIEDFFGQILQEFSERDSTHTVTLDMNCTVRDFRSDEKLLRNIVINLLTNAMKFSPHANTVLLKISTLSYHLKIEVADRGIGISEEDQRNLFTAFYRGSNVGSIQGTGLGLSIVKKAVDLLQGNIQVSSRAGDGTLFTVILPLGT